MCVENKFAKKISIENIPICKVQNNPFVNNITFNIWFLWELTQVEHKTQL